MSCPDAGRAAPPRRRRPRRAVTAAALATCLLAAASPAGAQPADAADPPISGSVWLDPRHHEGGRISSHFVGLSIEWSLIERYMGPNARPAFANLLNNLDHGILRIGGSSQDLMPFDAAAEDTNRVITPTDLAAIRSTLDATASTDGTAGWRVILGTAMAPRTDRRPWVGPEHTRRFVTEGVAPAFAGAPEHVVGVELGNEPDLTYRYDRTRYLNDFASYLAAGATGSLPIVTPATSEPIAPWRSIADRSVNTRFFWEWPQILDTTAPAMRANAGPLGTWTADHFYPLARGCSSDSYRCPTIPRLLSDERLDNFNYIAFTHAQEAARHRLGYRLEEINTSAGRGAHGVSDVAASALWALDTMFNAACPQPPNAPGANLDCGVGAIGVNFHNAEVNAFWRPEEGNGYYNTIRFDPSPAMGAPTAAPEYYALLLFSQFAQGTSGLRPVPVATDQAGHVKAWQVQTDQAERRLFLINKGDQPATLTVGAPASSYQLHRMSPYDPTGSGRTLAAPAVRVDGRQVAADGTWPGFRPVTAAIYGGRFDITVGAGEAVVIRLHQDS